MGSSSSPFLEGGTSTSLGPSGKLAGPQWPVLVLVGGNCEALSSRPGLRSLAPTGPPQELCHGLAL